MEGKRYDIRENAIFRNQPSYTYFNKSMESTDDCVFLLLNEIDKFFLQPEQIADKRAFQIRSLHDPRTKKEVTKTLYDHTSSIATNLFHSPKWSSLNGAQHAIGVRIVKARQEGVEMAEDDFYIWHKMESLREKESQEFQKFVYDFTQSNRELIYKPTRNLCDLYMKWYERKSKILLEKHAPETYNTHLGLPHLRVCKEIIKEPWAEILDVEIVPEVNTTCDSHDKQLDFKSLHRSLNACMEDYMNTECMMEDMENASKSEFLKRAEEECTEFPQYFIPLKSLMFLLTAGEYIDLPSEMLIDIKEPQEDSEGKKYIVMDTPLPSRHMGWHTYKQVVEQSALAFLSLSLQHEKEDIISNNLRQPTQTESYFKVQTLEEFMKSYKPTTLKTCRFGQSLTKWRLKAIGKEPIPQISTLTNCHVNDVKLYSIKLEHKPQFGCEAMSKYELLEEWFKLKLQNQTKCTCYRLDINNYETMVMESQSLAKLEIQLSTMYNISMPQILSNLYEFLSLLTTMPCGHYMLRYNSKFKDKLMLCKPSQEITQSTVVLHQLLKTGPTDLHFMAEQSYLPILDNLCSRMHEEHQILPCTFRPSPKQNLEASVVNASKPYEVFNDKYLIETRYKDKKKQNKSNGNNPSKVSKMNKKKAQRIRKKQRAAAASLKPSSENQELEELQREIELDQKMLGEI